MEDVNESSSENNIVIDGIKDFAGSPHQINKKAYVIALTADEDKEGNLSAVSTAINVEQQTFNTFTTEGYVRTLIHLHKWRVFTT